MSGDVQPRKRKDKKKKKDDLSIEEPRGTAAALGEGDVFIHSQQDHVTGGHWCAKIIFFSLLAVLITLIGLIILENRGLTELEANAVESRYSGVLEGWLEDAPDDDHHDEHTLDLKHHDDDEEDEDHHNVEELDHDEEDHEDEQDRDDEEDHEDEESHEVDTEADDELDQEESHEENTEADEEDEEEHIVSNEVDSNEEQDDNESVENLQDDDEDQEEHGDDSQEDDEEEIEKIEKEIIEEDADSNENVAHRNNDEYDEQASKDDREADDDDENDLQDQEDDDDEPPLERITAPPTGKPFVEIEEEVIEKPVNTLAEEEEYEKRQEQLRREEEEAAQGSQTWLKLAVGGALLVATHAVLRRATAPRDIPEPEGHAKEETPIVDRRMTITHEQFPPRVQESPLTQIAREIEEEVFKKPAPVTRSAPVVKQDSEEVIVKKGPVLEKAPVVDTKDEEKELYSDDDEEEEVEDDEEEEDIEEPLKKKAVPMVEQKPTEDSEPEDVEIIDDEQIEEELEDEEIEDEEEISDVDDTELLTRLEAKYGRLPEPERFGRQLDSFGPKHKDGGNSIEDDWPGEPSDAYWRTELNVAEEELRQGEWSSCERRVSAAALAGSGRARWLAARAADLAAEAKRDNSLLSRAIAAYLHLLKMNERLSDKKLLEVAQRAIDRIQFRGTYLNAEPIYRLLIRRFPDDVNYRNNLTVSFLMANRADLADEVLKETLRLWPSDRVALAHHGFVLKTKYNKIEEAVKALYKALEGDTGPANEPRFYYHLGDALLLLGRPEEANEVHKRGAALGHFLSPAQRSLYNVPRLRSRPWWPIEETPYVNLARALESSWKEILKEGEAAKELYEKEKEGLKERGDWTQLDLFVRGAEIPGRCARAPVTCSVVRREAAAARCRRGQVKFSAMAPGTHVRAHVGPTNCRLRMHLGLSNTKDTYIRVDKETRQWQTGKAFLFDDSFEHEVWHNGTGARLVLIVDVWHPDLTAQERRTLPAI